MALGIEGKDASQDFVAEVRGPEQAALISVVVFLGLIEKDRRRAFGEVGPAVGVEHGSVHVGVEVAQMLDVRGGLGAVVEAIVSLGHAFVAGDHDSGAVIVIRVADDRER